MTNYINVFHGKTVLITGHTGFKGSWLSLWLNHLGANVVGLASGIPTSPSHFSAIGLEHLLDDHRIDITDVKLVKNLIDDVKPDFIFHLAAQALVRPSHKDPLQTMRTNAMGSANILDALKTVSKLTIAIMITSDKVYDNVEWEWGYRETDRLGGKDPYSASKGMAELAIRTYVDSFLNSVDSPVRVGIARAGNVIGGGDWASDRIVPDCVRAWANGDSVQLRNPLATRPWQHVLEPLSGYLNLAAALFKDAKLHGESFNFGPPAQQNHSVGELVSAMSEYWDQVRWEDVSVDHGGPYESGLLKLNCDKALHHLSWQATWDFEDTVRETAFWYKRFYENTSKSIADFSLSQIAAYVEAAKLKGISWAQ